MMSHDVPVKFPSFFPVYEAEVGGVGAPTEWRPAMSTAGGG
jgi:hypothetical protein